MKNYKFYNNSEKAWKGMFEAIDRAEKSIFLEMYIFQNTIPDFDFFNLLKKKAGQGLTVKIILDSFGSLTFPKEAQEELKSAGVEVLNISYLLHRMHRKVLVTDEQVAFIGGVNIYKTSRFWNDLMVRMTGRLVPKVLRSFAKSYKVAGGKDPVLLDKAKTKVKDDEERIIEHHPVKNKFDFKKVYRKNIRKAEKEIILMTPYFMPKRWLTATLHQAVLRGVNVEILVPGQADRGINNRVNYFYVYKLSKLGIKFYMEKNMNHAKAMIIDRKLAMVGSPNLDYFSFDFNSEVGVFFKEPEAISKLLQIAADWKKDATLFDPKIKKPKWFDYILAPFINSFSLVYRILLD